MGPTENTFYTDMLNSSGSNSETTQLRERAESISMFFDFESPPSLTDFSFDALTMEDSTPSPRSTTSNSETTAKPAAATTAPRGGIRVSLACIPCRSRHVKCGAELPGCSRCATDDKPCFYAKSRRGMRDRNAPKKSKTTTSSKTSPNLEYASSTNSMGGVGYTLGNDSWGSMTGSSTSSIAGSMGNRSPRSDAARDRPVSTRRLIDLFYTYFYKAHPFVLPRYYLLTRLDSDPSSLTHLLTVISYVGTFYDSSIPTTPYRNAALALLDLPSLPMTGFSIQTLLLTAIALHCESRMDLARQVLDRAIFMSVELGMNGMDFADLEADAVLAESWRRTYFGLYTADSTLPGLSQVNGFL